MQGRARCRGVVVARTWSGRGRGETTRAKGREGEGKREDVSRVLFSALVGVLTMVLGG